jgi:hypothetical protein
MVQYSPCGIKIVILTDNFLLLVCSVFDCIPQFTQILIAAHLMTCQESSVNNHFSIFCLFKEMMYGDFANYVYILVIYCKLHVVCGSEVLRNICSWYCYWFIVNFEWTDVFSDCLSIMLLGLHFWRLKHLKSNKLHVVECTWLISPNMYCNKEQNHLSSGLWSIYTLRSEGTESSK